MLSDLLLKKAFSGHYDIVGTSCHVVQQARLVWVVYNDEGEELSRGETRKQALARFKLDFHHNSTVVGIMVDIVARQMLANNVDRFEDGGWEEMPDIGEGDYEAIVDRIREIAPDQKDFAVAIKFLEERAEKWKGQV